MEFPDLYSKPFYKQQNKHNQSQISIKEKHMIGGSEYFLLFDSSISPRFFHHVDHTVHCWVCAWTWMYAIGISTYHTTT